MGDFQVRAFFMFAYRGVVVRCHPAWADLVRDHRVIGTSNGATRADIERDIDWLLDEGDQHG